MPGSILQVEIYGNGVESFKKELKELFLKKSIVAIHLCNAYTIALASRNSKLLQVLKDSTFNLPDGKPISKFVNAKENIQIRGLDLVHTILSDPFFKEQNHLFFGSDFEGSLLLQEHLERKYQLDGRLFCLPAPYLEADDFNLDSLNHFLELKKIRFVWLGLGTPKQDFLVSYIVNSSKNPLVVIPVGAAFDFLIGRKRKSPKILSKIGLEWAFRLLSEPKRLAKRYLIYNLIFIWVIFNSLRHRFLNNMK